MTMSKPMDFAELGSLREVIASSPIVLRPPTLAMRLAEWETTRTSNDVDEVILAWLVSHAEPAHRRFDA
jgi:hypothetical protein